MSDQNSNETTTSDVAPEVDVVVEPTRLQKFVLTHPRAAKVVATLVTTTAVVGGAVTVNTMRKNKHHLDAAATDAKEALYEIGEAVSPTPETTV